MRLYSVRRSGGEDRLTENVTFYFTKLNYKYTVTKPDGTKKTLALETGARELVFGETFQQGIYRLKAGTNEVTFCVNLTDAAESNIMPRDE